MARMKTTPAISVFLLSAALVSAQNATVPFVPQPVLQGGQVVPLFPPDSPYLKKERIAEAEQNNMI